MSRVWLLGWCLLASAESNIEAPSDLDCGVVGLQNGTLGCHQEATTDCPGIPLLRGVCPSECPFVVPHSYLSCVFQRATASTCSIANPNLAFPNNATQLCEPCQVVGCKRCASKDTCAECFDNFWPEFGGRVCVYVWDDRAQHGMNAAFAFSLLLILILLAGVYLIDRCNCWGRCLPQEIESSPDALDDEEDALVRAQKESSLPNELGGQGELLTCDITPLSINQGKLHRLRCKVKNPEPQSKHREGMQHSQSLLGHMERQLPAENRASTLLGRFKNVPFSVNLHKKFLVGVGLPLFHQWHLFLFLYRLVMCAGTAWIYFGSDLSGQLSRTGLDHASHLLMEEFEVGKSAMTLCGLNSQENHLGLAAQDFGRRATLGYSLLWLVGMVLSLWHALRQKRAAHNFHQRHPSLAEFALSLEGFPASATDEDEILKFVRQSFGIQDLQISVCYDYRDRRARVSELWEKILVREDVAAGAYHPSLAAGPYGNLRSLGLSDDEKQEVRQWLDTSRPGALRNAGSVFVIFSHTYELHSAEQLPERFALHRLPRGKTPLLPHSLTPEFLPSLPLEWVDEGGRRHHLTVRDVACEPPEVAWEHLGLDVASISARAALAGLAVVVSFCVIAAVVFLPLATYSISYVSQAGSLPTGVMMSVMGILVMTVNWMIGLLHIFVSSKVGFARRDREGLLIFKAFSTLCFVSFLFNVAITIFPESSAHPLRFLLHPLGEGRPVTSMQDISFQVRASVHLFHVLVPGSLFIGYLLFPLQGFVWPAVSTISFLRFWHSRSFTPDLKAREAEKAMEPLGMSLGHDYMGFVVQPLSCSLTLFFASGVAWQTFAFLAAWSAFMMPFTRYMHLRAMRRSYFSTNRIDMDALFAWGFPHSQVLAASAFWAARIYNWTLLVVPATWLGALAVYHVLLAFIVQPLVLPKDSCESREVSYDEVRTRRFYDWHNCNPMKVLLSHCTSQKAIRPFEIGKEYLQENCPEWKERADKLRAEGGLLWTLPSDQVENEICPLMVPEVEDLLQRPVDWIGQASRSFATKSRLDVTSESPEAEPTLDPFQER